MRHSALFVCDASAHSGFGHAARCMHVASALAERVPGLDITFEGEFSDRSVALLRAGVPGARFVAPGTGPGADVALIDRMSVPEDIEACDLGRVAAVAARCRRVVYLTSGQTVPTLPAGVHCLGYQPGGPLRLPAGVSWSLDYAPVPSGLLTHGAMARRPGSALLAFGGALDDRAPRLAAVALAAMPAITAVTVLGSPVAAQSAPLPFRPDQRVTTLSAVPDVGPLLAEAQIVLASFGNLGYEAMALGAALCLVNVKRFQDRLAQELAARGLAVNAGLVGEATPERVHQAVAATLADAVGFSQRASAAIDGRGLDRIADLLQDHMCHG